MATASYLTFSLHELRYGLEATRVREIFPLPELTPIADAPGDIIGILNLRGEMLPVMHLDRRLGHAVQGCHLSDSVIVFEWEGMQVGAIVHQVSEVEEIEATAIEPAMDYGRMGHVHTSFVAGVAKVDGDAIALLNPETLIRQPDEVAMLAWQAYDSDGEADAIATAEPDSEETDSDLSLLGDWMGFVEDEEEAFPLDTPAAEAASVQSPLPPHLLEVPSVKTPSVEAASIPTTFFEMYCPSATPKERDIFRQRAESTLR